MHDLDIPAAAIYNAHENVIWSHKLQSYESQDYKSNLPNGGC